MADRKANLKIELEGFAISVPIRYAKMNSNVIREQLVIVTKALDGLDVSKKKRVYDKQGVDITEQTESKMQWLDSEGKIRDEADVKTYQFIDGKSEETDKYPEATTMLQGFEKIPAEKFNQYLQESDNRFELYADAGATPEETKLNENFLVLLAEYMINQNVCLKMNEFYRVRDRYNYALIMRAHKEGDLDYSLEFILTMTKLSYNHLLRKTDIAEVATDKKPKTRVKLNV